MFHAVAVSDVGDVHDYSIAEFRNVEHIAAVLRYKTVNYGHVSAEFHEPVRNVGTDEANSSRDEYLSAFESVVERLWGGRF
jgi:hypothetical protein